MNAWQGQPVWPDELTAAVGERLVQLKSELLDIVAKNVLNGRFAEDKAKVKKSKEEEEKELRQFLTLDEDYLETLSDDEAGQLRLIGSQAEADMKELLTEDQYREFQEVGISSLLARIEYSW